MAEIAITLNGETTQIAAETTVAMLLTSLHLDDGKVAVERNLEIVSCDDFATQTLAAGDQIEIVHFIGGG